MEITDKAKEYGEDKMLQAFTSAIEQAFTDGYTAGYKDGLDAFEAQWKNKMVDGVEYVDLQLPSGTLWSTSYLKNKEGQTIVLTYDEASKLNIPTNKQFEELNKYCDSSTLLYLEKDKEKGEYFVGRNGKWIKILNAPMLRAGEECIFPSFRFWLKNDEIFANNTKFCATRGIKYEFMGHRIPVMLVLTPEQKKLSY